MHFMFNPNLQEYEILFNEQTKVLDTFVLSLLGQFGVVSIHKIASELLSMQPNEKFYTAPFLKISEEMVGQSVDRLRRLKIIQGAYRRRKIKSMDIPDKRRRKTDKILDKQNRKKTKKKIPNRPPMIYYLELPGLMWYFRHSGKKDYEQERIANFFLLYNNPHGIKQNQHFRGPIPRVFEARIPFCPFWNDLVKIMGKDECLQVLQETIDNFFVFEKEVILFGTKTEIFGIYRYKTKRGKSKRLRNSAVFNYLLEQKNPFLREAYICYLINDYLHKDPDLSESANRKVSKCKFSREAKFLKVECRNSSEFRTFVSQTFSKYNSINAFFSGAFVNNLLWSK